MPDSNKNKTSKPKSSEKHRRLRIMRYIRVTNVVLIGIIFIAGFFYLLVFPRDTVSNEENRTLTTMPSLSASAYLDGSLTSGITDYYDDTVPNRSVFKKIIASSLLPLKGREYGDDAVTIYGSGFEHNAVQTTEALTTEAPTEAATEAPTTEAVTSSSNSVSSGTTTSVSTTSTTTVTTTTVTTLPDNHNDAADGEIANNIVVVNNRGIMLYGGGMENGLEYASYVNAYKEALGDSVNVYSMVCPTAVSYYMPENYLDLTASEKDNIDNINSALVNVTAVDAYDALLLHKEEAIYSRTDHHWQPLGAYYAAQAFAEAAGVPFADLSEYETVSLSGYVGTLYGYTQSAALVDNPEDFIYYIPKTQTVTTRYSTSFTDPVSDSLLWDPTNMSNSSYYMVFGSDDRITHVSTECTNGRTLVIFKDSYGNALLPVLTSSFENIYLCDIRYFDLNAVSFIQDVGATDLLFAMNTYSATGGNHDYILENLNK